MIPPLPANEQARLNALRQYHVLDTDAEQQYDDITLLASQICGTPIALISLVDENRQWFKSKLGIQDAETSRDISFCAHAILERTVMTVPDALEDDRFRTNPAVTGEMKLRFYAGAPLITLDGYALGSLCVVDQVPRELTPRQQMALQALSRQVVTQLELRRTLFRQQQTESDLRWKSAFLEAQINSTLDGIIVVDRNGRRILQNQRAIDLLKIPSHIQEDEDHRVQARWITGMMKNPDAFLEKLAFLNANPDKTSRDEVELKDGTILDRYSAPVTGLEGESYGRIWFFRDVTDRKHAEAEIEQMHRQIAQVSRQAGMAEVATNVLHNVGNALNSVNVSCCVVADRLRKMRISSVTKTAEHFQKHADDLSAYFATDPSARKMPDFLNKLARSLTQEQAFLVSEMQSVNDHVGHIKEIVAMQEGYARATGIHEMVAIGEVMEEALSMSQEGLAPHQIQVVRDYGEIPPVVIEKPKVQKILLNLLSNAGHALSEAPQPDRRLMVRTSRNNGHVLITVADNGVGIPRENLARIFSNGFTTRSNSRGHGLHASALCAEEMGGQLSAESEGYGTGATFTLQLPVHAA